MTATDNYTDTDTSPYDDQFIAVVEFESRLTKTCDAIGHDVDFLRSEEHVRKALRWMTQEERDNGWMKYSHDAEHWVWNQGFLFTERGWEVVEMLKKIWKMEY